MRQRIVVILLFTASFTGLCSAAHRVCAASVQAVPICVVLADAPKYDGKEITISGVYRMVIHGSLLTGAACPKLDVNVRRGTHWKGNRAAVTKIRSLTKKNQFQPAQIVSRGIFRLAREGQCFGQNCLQYEFEETELFCAAAVTAKDPSSPADPKPDAVPGSTNQ